MSAASSPLAKSIVNTNLLDSIYTVFMERFEDRLFPCKILRDEAGKKNVFLPKGWTDKTTNGYHFYFCTEDHQIQGSLS